MCYDAVKNNKGFTFIEVFVSLGLLGMISYFLVDLTLLSNRMIVDNRAEMDLLQTMRQVNSNVSDASTCQKNFIENGELMERSYSRLVDGDNNTVIAAGNKYGEFESIRVTKIDTKVNLDKSLSLILDFERVLGRGLKNYRKIINLFTLKKEDGKFECFSAGMAIAKKSIETSCDDVFSTDNYGLVSTEAYSGCERKKVSANNCDGSSMGRGISALESSMEINCEDRNNIKVACNSPQVLKLSSNGSFICGSIPKLEEGLSNYFNAEVNCPAGAQTFKLNEVTGKISFTCTAPGPGVTSGPAEGGDSTKDAGFTITVDDKGKNGTCQVTAVPNPTLSEASLWTTPYFTPLSTGGDRYNYSETKSYYQDIKKIKGSNSLALFSKASGKIFITGLPYAPSHFSDLTAKGPVLDMKDPDAECPGVGPKKTISYTGEIKIWLTIANSPIVRATGSMEGEITGIGMLNKEVISLATVKVNYSLTKEKVLPYIIGKNPDDTDNTKNGKECTYEYEPELPYSVQTEYDIDLKKGPILALSYTHINDLAKNGGARPPGGVIDPLANSFTIQQVSSFSSMTFDKCAVDAGNHPIAKYEELLAKDIFSEPTAMIIDSECPHNSENDTRIVLMTRFETNMEGPGKAEDKDCYNCTHDLWDGQVQLYTYRNCINEAVIQNSNIGKCFIPEPQNSCVENAAERLEFEQLKGIYGEEM